MPGRPVRDAQYQCEALLKLVMTLLVRDEDDIIEANIRYHLAGGVDHIVLMDNLSVDRTSSIARRFERKGRLTYIRQDDDNYAQGKWVTAMARIAFQDLKADWVINGDADEFWLAQRGSIKSTLQALPAQTSAISVRRRNFVARPRSNRPFWRRMNVREAWAMNALGEPLPPKAIHRGAADIRVEQGNHRVFRGEELIEAPFVDLEIFHFPARSKAQFINKIAKGGEAYTRNTDLPPEYGATWRQLFELHRAGRLSDYYDRITFDDEAIEEGLRTGQLVRDRRFERSFAARMGALSSFRTAIAHIGSVRLTRQDQTYPSCSEI